MSKHQDGRKWHQQKRWVIGSLLLFPPLGIPLLWLTRWPRAGKIGGSIFSGIILLSVLTGKSSEPKVVAIAEPPAVETATAPVVAEPVVSAAYEEAMAKATATTAEIAVAETSADWARIADQWQAALSSLDDIPLSSSDHRQAQEKIAEYQRNYDYAISQQAAIEAAESEAIAQQQAEAQEIAQQQAAAAQEPEMLMPVVEAQGGYVSGTCKELKAMGVGSDFRPGDANYTLDRDRDGDGVACES